MARGRRLAAACLDLDGVVVDSEPAHYEADRLALAEYGVKFSFEEKKANFVGRTVRDTMYLLSEAHGLPDPAEVLAKRQRHFASLVESSLELRAGAEALLERLAERTAPRALVTSGNRWYVDAIFERLGIGRMFDAVVTMEDVERHKPHPEPYLAGAKALMTPAEACLAIEDSPAGVLSAKAAGMYCVAAPGEFTLEGDFSPADARVESLDQIDDTWLDSLFRTA